MIVFQAQKKKKKTILPQKNQKIVLLEKLKTNFFAITVNWYKYLLTVASC